MKQYEVNTDKAKIIQEFCKRYDFNYLVPMYYEASNNGDKGRKGTFYDACQTCKKYAPQRGGFPARKNTKKQKLREARDRDSYDF